MGVAPHTLLQHFQELELEKNLSVIQKHVMPDTCNIMTAVIFPNKKKDARNS
jgi:hypothetical protein